MARQPGVDDGRRRQGHGVRLDLGAAGALRTASRRNIALTVAKISRSDLGDVAGGQPRTWTFVEFDAADADADRLANAHERVLERAGGWYCDFRSDQETFVVFAGQTFRYPRGDESGRGEAAEYARSVGVPEAQLDWPV